MGITLGALVLFLLPWRFSVVIGSSMEPFLRSGDLLIFHRNLQKEIHRGSLIVFRDNEGVAIKKVHAVPGDRITEIYQADIREASLVPPEDEWRWKRLEAHRKQKAPRLLHLTVPNGFVYVLGTGAATIDSRSYGLVPLEKVLGVVQYGPKRPVDWSQLDWQTTEVPPRI